MKDAMNRFVKMRASIPKSCWCVLWSASYLGNTTHIWAMQQLGAIVELADG